MATPFLSRSAFAPPEHPSFTNLIQRITAAGELRPDERSHWCWSLCTVARVAGKSPEAMLAHPDFIRVALKSAAPQAHGIGRGAWNNARSGMNKAMFWAGLASIPGRYQAPYSPAWAALWRLLPQRTALSYQLSRFFHFCSAQQIAPEQVNDAVLSRFNEALVAEGQARKPYECYRGTARSWNNAVARYLEWPQVTLSVPSKRKDFSLPWDAFPASLRTDTEAYLARAAGNRLDDDDFTRAQSPATIEKRRKQLRWFATGLVKAGIAAERLTGLAVMLDPSVAVCGLEFLRRDGKSYPELSNLTAFLATLAKRLGMAEEKRLRGYAKKLKVKQDGMAERHLATLRKFNDPAMVEALLTLPERLSAEVRRSNRHGIREAQLMQTAVAIALLENAPVRIGNLAAIELNRHIVEVSAQPRVMDLQVPRHEVKNKVTLEFRLTPDTTALLDEYIAKWLPLLAEAGNVHLFPGKKAGRSKGSNTLSKQIQKVVKAHTGLDMPAHRFRHAIGKIYLDRNPGQYEVVRQLLGHKDIMTTIRFYAGAESVAASRQWNAAVLGIREASHG